MNRLHYCYLLTRALPEGGCRYYVGIRTYPLGKTPETDTSYMGRGPWIRRAVKAHPGEFSKTIVETFDTIAEAKALERALVGLATANSPYSYNLMEGGGSGGLASEETKAKMRGARRLHLSNPENAARQAALNRRADVCAKRRAAAVAQHADPEFKARHAAATTATNRATAKNPGRRAKLRAAMRLWWTNATEAQRKARSAGLSRGAA